MEEWLAADLARCYGLCAGGAVPVSGGWLNEKWRISGADGDWLVKCFSPRRFSPVQLGGIEAALERQERLAQENFPCPQPLRRGGHLLRRVSLHGEDVRAYTVMRFCRGQTPTPGSLSPMQLFSLGEVCGRMHCVLARLPAEGAKGFPAGSGAYLTALHTHFARKNDSEDECLPATYRQAVRMGREILPTLTAEWIDLIPRGLAHEDFTPDNMLFHETGVSAILDFDRSRYSLRFHDVGRALVSFALAPGDDAFDCGAASAFVQGYALHYRMTPADVTDALRCVWIVEAPWWICSEFFTDRSESSPKVLRFRDELLWLTEHWDELGRIGEAIMRD